MQCIITEKQSNRIPTHDETKKKAHDSHMSQCMRFPTIWYVRPAKTQTSLRIRAV